MKTFLKNIFILWMLITAGVTAQAATVTQTEVTEVYVATFDRAPDADGLKYWVNSGLSIEEIAESFFAQPETQKKYPDSMPTKLFIREVYQNMFNRQPEEAGLAYWAEALENGNVSRGKFILALARGAQDTGLGKDKSILANKTAVGLYYAEEGLNDLDLAKRVMQGVTASSSTVTRAEQQVDQRANPLHKNISVTTFWIGEEGTEENNYIPNIQSAWDDNWKVHYGGTDDPNDRNGYLPANFTPYENPFYFALPYNDFNDNGERKASAFDRVFWSQEKQWNSLESMCKNRWIKIVKGDKSVYAQWEDVGPFGEDDAQYVFGNALPKNEINNHAGLDVSPAVKDYLELSDVDKVNWHFIDSEQVPDGPWKETVTNSQIDWGEEQNKIFDSSISPVTTGDWYKPEINTSWQWQLQGNINTSYNVEIYDIDLFDSSTALIQSLKNDGKKVICYFSAGSYENWRSDKDQFPSTVLGNTMDGWEDEQWLDISNENLASVMRARLDLAREKGCDGVEPDNMDGYTNNTGFSLNANDQLAYNKFIANEARKRGLSVGLKNDLDQIIELEPYYDFSVNEQCHEYNECDNMQPFIDANKPVLNAEYLQEYVDNTNSERDNMCNNTIALKFKTLILPLDLDDSFRYSCN